MTGFFHCHFQSLVNYCPVFILIGKIDSSSRGRIRFFCRPYKRCGGYLGHLLHSLGCAGFGMMNKIDDDGDLSNGAIIHSYVFKVDRNNYCRGDFQTGYK